MQDVLKEEGGKGNHFEIPPADFLSDVDFLRREGLHSLILQLQRSGTKKKKLCLAWLPGRRVSN